MATYGRKYTIGYKTISERLTTIDILQKDYYGSVTELLPTDNPLEISWNGNENNILTPTVGSGCTIKVYAQPLTMLELFTEDDQEFKVIVYSGDTGGNVLWQGFVNAQVYSEDYSSAIPVPISIACNDGLGVLQNIKYMTEYGTGYTFYTGATMLGTIMGNALSKIDLTFDKIYCLHDLQMSSGHTNFFTDLNISAENFFNESLEAQNCREVLNAVLSGLGLTMRLRGRNIYIINPLLLYDNTQWRTYDLTPIFGTGETETTLYDILDISDKDIEWFETGTKLDLVPSYSQISVEYDPYNCVDDTYNFNEEKNIISPGNFYNEGLLPPYSGEHYVATDCAFNGWADWSIWWDIYPPEEGQYVFVGLKEKIDDTPEYCIKLENTSLQIKHTSPYVNICQDEEISLKISAEFFLQTKTDDHNIYTDNGTPTVVNQMTIPIAVVIGNDFSFPDGDYQVWMGGNSWNWNPAATGQTVFQPMFIREEGYSRNQYSLSEINDTWTKSEILVPIARSKDSGKYLVNGKIQVSFYDNLIASATWWYDPDWTQQYWPNTAAYHVHKVFIKNVKLDFVLTKTGEVIGNKGLKTTINTGLNLTNRDALSLKTTVGTGTYGISRSALKSRRVLAPSPPGDLGIVEGDSGIPIRGLARGRTWDTGTTLYNTSYLILQDLITQYQRPRLRIDGTLDVRNHLMDTEMYLIKDTDYLNTSLKMFGQRDPAFYISGYKYNDRDESMDVQMLELASYEERITLPEGIPTWTPPLTGATIGFSDEYGNISFSGISNYIIAVSMKFYAEAGQSWINCDYPPQGHGSYSFTIDSDTVSDDIWATGASEEDKDVFDSNTQYYTFSGITSGSTVDTSVTANNEYNLCGDGSGFVYFEILSVTVIEGTPGVITVDPENNRVDFSNVEF